MQNKQIHHYSQQYNKLANISNSSAYQMDPKYQATEDLYLILNSFIKRRFIRALEDIKTFNFNSSRKELITDNINRGFKLNDSMQSNLSRKTKRRAKSVDPYAEYSRAKLLQDIVRKLKAKNQISKELNLSDYSNIDIRITNIERMIQ